MLYAQRNLLCAIERTAQLDGGRERVFLSRGCACHHADQARPINLRGALELPRTRISESRNVRNDQDIAGLIQTAAASAAKHLQQLVRLDMALEISGHVFGARDEN